MIGDWYLWRRGVSVGRKKLIGLVRWMDRVLGVLVRFKNRWGIGGYG